jgi:nucleoside-diphosphate-sugar epimerase
MAWDWAADHSSSAVTVLRPALVLTGGEDPWLTQTLGPPRRVPRRAPGPPRQFLHVDDLVSAIVHVVDGQHDGLFNVAPDGWAPADTARTLAAWRSMTGELPAGSIAYSRHPWVVANDRLRATGWAPTSTSEEAVVATRHGVWWRELSPNRRQQLALGVVGLVGVVAAAAASLGLRRRTAVRRV